MFPSAVGRTCQFIHLRLRIITDVLRTPSMSPIWEVNVEVVQMILSEQSGCVGVATEVAISFRADFVGISDFHVVVVPGN